LIDQKALVFLESYPPKLSALAKINDEGWASRFEVYYQGVELGNAYDELMDSVELKARWEIENKIRESAGLAPHPIDEDLIKITGESFIKGGTGIAIGLERLFSLTLKQKSIKVWPF
jgi:lysyl-tRNA synthetase class 2